MNHGHNNEEMCDECFAADHIKTCASCEEHPDLHPHTPMSQWELDGMEQAIKYARTHKRHRLYQALTGDLDETPADHGEAPQGAKW